MNKEIFRTEKGKDCILRFYNNMLEQFPLVEHFFIETKYGTTFIVSAGEEKNPPLLLLHGSGSNSLAWMGDMEKLSQSYRVYSLDIPGEPGKSEAVRFDTKGDTFSLWLDEVINRLALDKPLLGGLSLGGWAVIRYALTYPEKTAGVIALAPTGIVKPKISFLIKTIFYSIQGEKGIRKLLSIMFDGAPVPEEVVQFQVLLTRHFRYRMDNPALFTDRELKNLKVPLTYVCGEKDYIFDAKKAVGRLEAANPDITTALLENGHALTNISSHIPKVQNGTNTELSTQ